ncbi:MAG: ferrochelatase [Chlamydiia bacterium]|nr:ferrochelatase [Chlamydiia bacterium]
MERKKRGYLLVNFGGPRSLVEVRPFLEALLTDQEVVRTKFPSFIHKLLFKKIAKKRAIKIQNDYASIGGKSPVYEDTEHVANALRRQLHGPLVTFHRYLPATHKESLYQIKTLDVDKIVVFPMFPHFTYATTGSCATFFDRHLPSKINFKIRWVKSYPTHPAFIDLFSYCINEYLAQHHLRANNTVLLFSAHGLPKLFIDTGDIYQSEIENTFFKVMEQFPEAVGQLAYQSKFGPGEWLTPSTEDVCRDVDIWNKDKKAVLFIPISFTTDHIETLFEIEKKYVPLIKKKGIDVHRLPAFNGRKEWIDTILAILRDAPFSSNSMLLRH